MSSYSHNRFDIKGDGNAVGDNNQITIVKQDNRRYTDSGGGGKSDDNPMPALAVTLGFALALGSYYFARHADAAYTWLRIMAAIEVSLVLVAGGMYWRREAYMNTVKCAVIASLVALTTIALHVAHGGYPAELTSLATSSSGVRQFWCGLSLFGKQLALLHMVAATFGFGLGMLLLLPVTLTFGFFSTFPVEVTERMYRKLEGLTSWGLIAMAAPLLLAAMFAHTAAGWEAWVGFVQEPPTLIFCLR